MKYQYVIHDLCAGTPPTKDDIFALSSVIADKFLNLPRLYDVYTVGIHLGSFSPKRGVTLLPPEFFGPPTIGTYYGNNADDFGPLEKDGVHFEDSKIFNDTGDYTESIQCVLLSETFDDVLGGPARKFFLPDFIGAVTYYFAGDGRLVYLPLDTLKKSREPLGVVAARSGQVVGFDLEWRKKGYRQFRDGDSMALFWAGKN